MRPRRCDRRRQRRRSMRRRRLRRRGGRLSRSLSRRSRTQRSRQEPRSLKPQGRGQRSRQRPRSLRRLSPFRGAQRSRRRSLSRRRRARFRTQRSRSERPRLTSRRWRPSHPRAHAASQDATKENASSDPGWSAYAAGCFIDAIRIWRPLAEQGDARAVRARAPLEPWQGIWAGCGGLWLAPSRRTSPMCFSRIQPRRDVRQRHGTARRALRVEVTRSQAVSVTIGPGAFRDTARGRPRLRPRRPWYSRPLWLARARTRPSRRSAAVRRSFWFGRNSR